MHSGLNFVQGAHDRHVGVDITTSRVLGLVELIDNNPLVCTDAFGIPDPANTLALIALGPLAEAGLILEPPALLTNQEVHKGKLRKHLANAGCRTEVTLATQTTAVADLAICTAICAIRTPENPGDVDGLYEERYGKSFFVRACDSSDWEPQMVLGKPYALYSLRLTLGDADSLLTIQVMADVNGKCGAAQYVHAMNVMAGFEETIGLEGELGDRLSF